MSSRSSTGSSNVTLQLDLDRDIDGAAVDVQTAIAEVTPLLPPGMPSPPAFAKSHPADDPIIFLSLVSNTMSMSELDEFAETVVAPRISMVNGVAQVQVMGAQKFAVRVQLDPDKLAAKRIGLNEVDTALNNWNVNSPLGALYGPHTSYNIYANGQLRNAEAFKPMVVAWRNGRPVRLEDIANVIDSVQDDKNASWLYNKDGGQRAITLSVMRQPGSNTIEVTDNVRALLPMFEKELQPSAHLLVRGDRSKNIRDAFKDIQFTMVITLVLVIGVIFFFLRNAPAILISGVVSITFTPMLCSRFLRAHEPGKRHNLIYRATEAFFNMLLRGYDWSLRGVLRHRAIMSAVFFIVVGGTIYLFNVVPKGFIPDADTDQISVTLEAAQGTSFYKMVEYCKRLADIVRADPNVDTFMASVGGGFGGMSGNSSRMSILLKPRNERQMTVPQIIDRLRPKISNFPGFRCFMTIPPTIP